MTENVAFRLQMKNLCVQVLAFEVDNRIRRGWTATDLVKRESRSSVWTFKSGVARQRSHDESQTKAAIKRDRDLDVDSGKRDLIELYRMR